MRTHINHFITDQVVYKLRTKIYTQKTTTKMQFSILLENFTRLDMFVWNFLVKYFLICKVPDRCPELDIYWIFFEGYLFSGSPLARSRVVTARPYDLSSELLSHLPVTTALYHTLSSENLAAHTKPDKTKTSQNNLR